MFFLKNKPKSFFKIIQIYNEHHLNKIDLPLNKKSLYETTLNEMSENDINKSKIVCSLERLLQAAEGDIRFGELKGVPILLIYGNNEIRTFILNIKYRYVEETNTGYSTSRYLRHSNSNLREVYYIEKEISTCKQTPNRFTDKSAIDRYID